MQLISTRFIVKKKLKDMLEELKRLKILTTLVSRRHFFAGASEHVVIATLAGKFIKTPMKFAIFDHVLLDGHKANFDNFFHTSKRKQCI